MKAMEPIDRMNRMNTKIYHDSKPLQQKVIKGSQTEAILDKGKYSPFSSIAPACNNIE